MFVWAVDTFRAALRAFQPALAEAMDALAPAIGTPQWDAALAETYSGLQRISVDYAVMERTKNITMARGAFDWDDVGSWPAVAHHFAADAAGNVLVGAAEALDARGNLVLSRGQHLVALYGVEGPGGRAHARRHPSSARGRGPRSSSSWSAPSGASRRRAVTSEFRTPQRWTRALPFQMLQTCASSAAWP